MLTALSKKYTRKNLDPPVVFSFLTASCLGFYYEADKMGDRAGHF
jgi:hypothetical protein